ncbi:MAG: hypothetical protein A2133_01930 [Actinobacteria bacterium RBG_16_64_13]|nr:MAG: hypothetical protein A2133_01930 [Actinobacteria bacterium RBG_16_64_13]
MKRIWKRKWLVIVATAAVFLSLGAVAWAATGDDPATDPSATIVAAADTTGGALTAVAEDDTATATGPGAAIKKAVREKKQQWLKRQAALMQLLRDDMTPADQALYDQLVAEAKQKREALQEARQDLNQTMKQLRDLAHKYLDAAGDTTG